MTDPTPKPPIEQPPVFSSWKTWYTLVLGNLVLMMAVLYFLTASYK